MRTIARIDIKSNFVIKGINLEGLRKIGDPIKIVNDYYANGIDELANGAIVLASPESSKRPSRGPSNIAPANAAAPPALCTNVDPAKSEKPAAARCPPPHCHPISIG